MSDNTTLNSGSGGDIMRTEDIGGGVKIPASKMYVGAHGTDGGPITPTNPAPVVIASGGLGAGVFAFHNVDNQQLGSTATGLNVGGVTQLLNVTGNLDRQRETGLDTIPALGVTTSANQLASPFVLTGNSVATGSTTMAIPVTSLSGTSRGAFWAIQAGTVLQVGSYGDPGYEQIVVTQVNTAANPQTFTAGFSKTHVAPFAISGNVYNQSKDATVADGATGQGIAAGATYLLNKSLQGGAGGWEGERSAAGELDGATGNGTAIAAEYLYNSRTFDRTRNLQGVPMGSGSLQTALVSGSTQVVPAVLPVGLQAGAPLLLWGFSDTPEVVYTTSSYVGGSSPINLLGATSFAHTSGCIIQWAVYSPFGPGLGPVAPFGIGVEEDVVWAPTVSASFIERAADQDGMAPYNMPAESPVLWNGLSMDRLRGVSGSANVGITYDPSGQMLSGSTVRTVQYFGGDFNTSGSANQVILPQGANNRIRVLSLTATPIQPVGIRWLSTGSAGVITNLSGLVPMAANGGYVLPYNPHGWFQTLANEGLNISLNAAVGVGLVVTWIIAGP